MNSEKRKTKKEFLVVSVVFGVLCVLLLIVVFIPHFANIKLENTTLISATLDSVEKVQLDKNGTIEKKSITVYTEEYGGDLVIGGSQTIINIDAFNSLSKGDKLSIRIDSATVIEMTFIVALEVNDTQIITLESHNESLNAVRVQNQIVSGVGSGVCLIVSACCLIIHIVRRRKIVTQSDWK